MVVSGQLKEDFPENEIFFSSIEYLSKMELNFGAVILLLQAHHLGAPGNHAPPPESFHLESYSAPQKVQDQISGEHTEKMSLVLRETQKKFLFA